MNNKKIALVTGISGQDGSYLAEFLLSKDYEVHGIIRRASSFNTSRIDHLYQDPHEENRNFILHYGDMTDTSNLFRIIKEVQPTEIYNLAAQSHVAVSFEEPEHTANSDALGTLRLLEAIRVLDLKDKVKFYQASTSELYGNSDLYNYYANEVTPFHCKSPYAAAKLYAYWITRNYREAYDIFACNGILFNHSSPRRGETFVTRKITRAISNIFKGNQKRIYLGNIDSKRDWGFAPEFVEAMWLILQQDKPDDFVIGTEETHSVREFLELAFKYVGIGIVWKGTGVNEVGIISDIINQVYYKRFYNLKKGDIVVEIDSRYFRPTDVTYLRADITKARGVLHWNPRVTFKELIKIMIDYDFNLVGLEPIGEGIEICSEKDFCYTKHDLSLMEKIREGC